jgi:hypothetical protein
MRPFVCLSVLGLFSGCSSLGGVYLVELEAATEGMVCEESMEENFENNVEAEGDETTEGDWTFTESVSESASAFFIELVALDHGQWALLYADSLALSTESSGGTNTFEWDDFYEESEGMEHQTGYIFAGTVNDSSLTTVEMEGVGGGELQGTWSMTMTSVDTWSESDTWDSGETGMWSGSIPSYDYLFDEDGWEIENSADMEDCSDENCELTVSLTCSLSLGFVASRTEGDPSGDYQLPVNTAGLE